MKKEYYKLENCIHIFHSFCIEKWTSKNNSCPLCRRPINKNIECVRDIFYYSNFYSEERYINSSTEENSLEPGRDIYDEENIEDSSNSDDEKSIDYGDESDSELSHSYYEDIFSFRLTDNLSVSYM